MNSKKFDILSSRSYFSRAGKASLSKFKILLEKDQILSGEKPTPAMNKTKSQPLLLEPPFATKVSSELENLKLRNHEPKPVMPSAVFKSPGRKDIFPHKDVPELGKYDISYNLVEKSSIFYSNSKSRKHNNVSHSPDSFLSPSLHQFPDKKYKGIPFQWQTDRKDITEGQPSPHEERFNIHNLIPKSCSKFMTASSPNLAKYAERHDFYLKKEFSPDYCPNKEYVMPKITHNIKFVNMTERKSLAEEKDWPKIFDVNMGKQEKKVFIEELAKNAEKRNKKSSNMKISRPFSPSNFVEEPQ